MHVAYIILSNVSYKNMPADPNNKIKSFQITDKLVIWTVYTDLLKKKKRFIH